MSEVGHQETHESPQEPTQTVYMVFTSKDGSDILLLKRPGRNPGDLPSYNLPAGHCEAGETPAETVNREVTEEVGVSVNFPSQTEPNHTSRFYKNGQEVPSTIGHFFVISSWEGTIRNVEPEEALAVEWKANNPEELKEVLPPHIVKSLQDMRDNISETEYHFES